MAMSFAGSNPMGFFFLANFTGAGNRWLRRQRFSPRRRDGDKQTCPERVQGRLAVISVHSA